MKLLNKTARRCKHCHRTFSAFRSNYCRRRCYRAEYDRTNRKRRAAYNRQYYQKNKERHRKWCAEWATKHPRKMAALYKRYYSKPENKRKRDRYHKRWMERNPEARRRYSLAIRKWRRAHPIKARRRDRQAYLRHREKKLAMRRRYVINNYEKVIHSVSQRSFRIKGAKGSHTLQQWLALKRRHNNRCLACRRKEPHITLTRDHVLPIIKGGSNFIRNIQPLCRSCNSVKHDRYIRY